MQLPAQASCLRGLRYLQGKFANARGQQLFYCAAFPTLDVSVRGVVLFLHGIGEHSLRFTHVYKHLCDQGYGVLAYDLLAHGQSDDEVAGVRAHSDQFQHFVDDTNEFLTRATSDLVYAKMLPQQTSESSPPLVFMGISFGALVGLNTILSGQHRFSACVLASPAIAVEMTPVLRVMNVVSGPLVWLFPTARLVPGVNFAGLTRDPVFLEDYMADPLNMKENLTSRMAVQITEGMTRLQSDKKVQDASSAFCQTPLLVLQGTEDKVTSVAMVEQFMKRAASQDKQLKLFDGLFHCLFNEPEKQEVLDCATNWLGARVAKPAPAAMSSRL